ncbi:MAG TPA: pyridoxamine 5'-phosphate oxidase family protein [candidate division Zixibacteria bacterium]|jgi:nitroimidazol reductase NimA-like FMN-containing flavoprotein (pyridoxamine 5'-phosphate oxidase superfamily)|nr:pyridoxamine 5'-phosphate oxidase family protein [candidate division Zixibacteria bacterium]
MSQYEVTQKTKIKRLPDRAEYDRETIHGILDEALICHVGFVVDDQPYVIPTIHARVGDTLYLHGSAASRMLRTLGKGANACVTVTLLDGLVLARSAFHHSMNYRSVVILGPLEEVIDPDERNKVLDALVEHIIPGRLAEARRPTRKELKATTVVKIQISEASAKIRTGPPGDDDEDYDLPVWAGVIPLSLQPGKPISDPLLKEGIDMPDYVVKYAPGDGHPSK